MDVASPSARREPQDLPKDWGEQPRANGRNAPGPKPNPGLTESQRVSSALARPGQPSHSTQRERAVPLFEFEPRYRPACCPS